MRCACKIVKVRWG